MKLGYIFIGFIAALFIYTIVVTEPPYGLDATPPTKWWITLSQVG